MQIDETETRNRPGIPGRRGGARSRSECVTALWCIATIAILGVGLFDWKCYLHARAVLEQAAAQGVAVARRSASLTADIRGATVDAPEYRGLSQIRSRVAIAAERFALSSGEITTDGEAGGVQLLPLTVRDIDMNTAPGSPIPGFTGSAALVRPGECAFSQGPRTAVCNLDALRYDEAVRHPDRSQAAMMRRHPFRVALAARFTPSLPLFPPMIVRGVASGFPRPGDRR